MFRKAWIVIVGSLLMIMAVPGAAQDVACDEGVVRANVQRIIQEGFNQGNTAVVNEVFAEDYVAHPDELDREGFTVQLQALRTAVPTGEAHTDFLLVEGCDVFFIFHYSGLMEGELTFPGQDTIPPTGHELHLDAHIYLHLNEAGQVVEEWDYVDNLSYLTQVGVIPSTGAAAPMAEAAPEAMMADTVVTSGNEARDTEIVNQALETGLNSGEMDALQGLYTTDYVGHDNDGTAQSLDQLISSIAALRTALPDVSLAIHDSVAQGGYVATRVTVTGTFRNALAFPGSQPIPPTSKPMVLEISFLHRVTPEGLIAEDWELFDQLSFLSQAGLFNMEASGEANTDMTPEVTPGS